MEKLDSIKSIFKNCQTQEQIYQEIISIGRKLSPFDPSLKTEENRVHGCQSVMYLTSHLENNQIYFSACSEALISAGLAFLLILFYNGKTPEEVIKIPPTFLEDLNIPTSLTPGRANGLSSLYFHMKKLAINYLIKLNNK